MTARLIVACDGTTRPGLALGRCRAFLPLPMIGDLDATRGAAVAAGWALNEDSDLCPACTRAGHGD